MEPYKNDKGQGYFIKSYCAYFDILGFSEKIENHDLEFFNHYLTLLEKETKFLRNASDFKIKIFTDNFVIGLPWKDVDAEPELGYLFDILARIQFRFAIEDVFIRGAVSISNLFMDDNTVLGPALIEAYKLENREQYPRIILSGETIKKVKKHISYYGQSSDAPQSRQYLIDVDGSYFINYLNIINEDNYGDTRRIKRDIKKHKIVLERNLKKHRNNFKVLNKFLWIARYHNYYCENFLPSTIHIPTIQNLLTDNSLINLSIKRAHET